MRIVSLQKSELIFSFIKSDEEFIDIFFAFIYEQKELDSKITKNLVLSHN